MVACIQAHVSASLKGIRWCVLLREGGGGLEGGSEGVCGEGGVEGG